MAMDKMPDDARLDLLVAHCVHSTSCQPTGTRMEPEQKGHSMVFAPSPVSWPPALWARDAPVSFFRCRWAQQQSRCIRVAPKFKKKINEIIKNFSSPTKMLTRKGGREKNGTGVKK